MINQEQPCVGENTRGSPVQQQPWSRIGLGVLPELWIVFHQCRPVDWISIEVSSIVLLLISLSVIGIGYALDHRLSSWSLPALGALLWIGGEWSWRLHPIQVGVVAALYELPFEVSPRIHFWVLLSGYLTILVLIPCLAFYLAHKKSGLHIPRSGWWILGLLILVGLIHICLYTFPHPWLSSRTVFKISFILTFVAVGPLLGEKGVAAALFVVCCEPLWIESFLNPTHTVLAHQLESPDTILNLASILLSVLPALTFLIVIPFGMLRSRSERQQKWWLLLPSACAFAVIEIVRCIALQNTPDRYTAKTWLWVVLAAIQLWLPILLATVLYAQEPAPKSISEA